jgi:hypothetical protein
VALFEELGTDARELVTPKGRAQLWTLAPTIYVTRVSGHMDESHAELFESYGLRRIQHAKGAKIRVFHDWYDMTGYESKCRQRLTSWSIRHLDVYAEVHICLRSKIVAMGVQVANIALRSIMRVHPDRAKLELQLRRVMRATPDAPKI